MINASSFTHTLDLNKLCNSRVFLLLAAAVAIQANLKPNCTKVLFFVQNKLKLIAFLDSVRLLASCFDFHLYFSQI